MQNAADSDLIHLEQVNIEHVDSAIVKKVFNEYINCQSLSRKKEVDFDGNLSNRLHEVLREYGVHLPPAEIKALVTRIDIENNGELDLRKFEDANFDGKIPISVMLASCLAIPILGSIS